MAPRAFSIACAQARLHPAHEMQSHSSTRSSKSVRGAPPLLKHAEAKEVAVSLKADPVAGHEARLLQGLRVVGAGFIEQPPSCLAGQLPGAKVLTLFYCIKGSGWCEAAGRLHTVRKGDVLILAPGGRCSYGSSRAEPWSAHWVQAAGGLVPDYLDAVGATGPSLLVSAGPDLQSARLCPEILGSSRQGSTFIQRLQASHALACLLAWLIRKRHEGPRETEVVANKVAEAIIYMSNHLEEPLRVTVLARMAGFSQAYFGELFKGQIGCAPRDYLHLLRIHRASQLLLSTDLSVKAIAAKVGYQDPFHFSRQFKAFQGAAPTQYRLRSSVSS
jgi:AraC family transcriptional regulator of arabinose operon